VNKRVLEQDANDLEDSLRVSAGRRSTVGREFEWMLRSPGDTRKLVDGCPSQARQVDRLRLHVQAAGIELGEVEQIVGELRQPPDLSGHRVQELAPRGLIQLFVFQQLQEAS